MGDWETAIVTVGLDGAGKKTNFSIVSKRQNHLAIRNTGLSKFYIVLPKVTVGGPTAGLGSCVERARTVIT